MSAVREFLHGLVAARSPRPSVEWLESTCAEIGSAGTGAPERFPTLISLASRRMPRTALAPTPEQRAQAFDLVEGWNPERWTVLDAARALLVLSRPDLQNEPDARFARESGVRALEDCFQYADVGELVALYRSLALLPDPAHFVWRAGEGCRSSMRVVFEAAACDTPYAFRFFDDIAWRQLAIKALFVEAPLWRVFGLDRRLDAELARMALDLADERRSAGRDVQHELWLCLGRFGGERGRAALERELSGTNTTGRRAAAIALARAGALERLSALHSTEKDPLVRQTMQDALKGRIQQDAFKDLDPGVK